MPFLLLSQGAITIIALAEAKYESVLAALEEETKKRLDAERSATEHATELFVKRVSDYLDKARNDHRYDRLHLVAAPKFLGQLRKELGKEVQKLVTSELPKDLSWLDARELEAKLLPKAS